MLTLLALWRLFATAGIRADFAAGGRLCFLQRPELIVMISAHERAIFGSISRRHCALSTRRSSLMLAGGFDATTREAYLTVSFAMLS